MGTPLSFWYRNGTEKKCTKDIYSWSFPRHARQPAPQTSSPWSAQKPHCARRKMSNPARFLRFPTDTSCFSAWNMDDGYPAVLHHKGAGNICSTVQQPSRVASLYLFPQYRGQERIVIPSRFGEGSQRSYTVGQVMDTTLPIDTLVNVFKHLDLASKACALCVCKEWHRAGKQFERSWQLMHVFLYAGITVDIRRCALGTFQVQIRACGK